MSENNREDRFLEQVKKTLDDSAAGLDGQTRSQLTQARHRALSAVDQPKKSLWTLAGIPAAGVVAVGLAIMIGAHFFSKPSMITTTMSPEDMEIMVSGESLDFLNELEFYSWLAEEENIVS